MMPPIMSADSCRDFMTVLRHDSQVLTKIWKADGSIQGYGMAKSFAHERVGISSFDGMVALLASLASDRHACIIRGEYVGDEMALTREPNMPLPKVYRRKSLFSDVPHHWLLIEVDEFEPLAWDPVLDAERAIDEYIVYQLPEVFQAASFYWQLSSSAGSAKNRDKLKVHLWFWMESAASAAQLRAWAREKELALDTSVYDDIQVHYTAFPLFESGLTDPVPVRCGVVRRNDNLLLDLPLVEAAAPNLPVIARRPEDMVDDPVLNYLRSNRYIRAAQLSNGAFPIHCPFDHASGEGVPSSTVWLPAGVGGKAEGRWSCMHESCSDKTHSQFLAAIGYSVRDEFEVMPVELGSVPRLQLEQDKKGLVLPSIDNLIRALEDGRLTGVHLVHDTFHDEMLWCEDGGSWTPLTDGRVALIRRALEVNGVAQFRTIGTDTLRQALAAVGETRRMDRGIGWIDALSWDGIARVETFMSCYFRAEDTAYTRAVSFYLWTALAGRMLEPGCQVDMVPVLSGAQGGGKSSGVRAMAPWAEAFRDIDLTAKDDDISRKLRGASVCEISELNGLHTRARESIKAFVTRTFEEWVPKFKEFSHRFLRRNVFIGTTNDQEFLADGTGERRWLPVRVGKVDVETIKRDKDQLWAEAAVLWRAGGVQWRAAEELARDQHSMFKMQDPLHDAILAWLDQSVLLDEDLRNRDGPFDGNVLLAHLATMPHLHRLATQKRVYEVLRLIGFEQDENPRQYPFGRRRAWHAPKTGIAVQDGAQLAREPHSAESIRCADQT